jgi:hypothetical protein
MDVMLSVHCGTMLSFANSLKTFLMERGYSVFLCDSMTAGANYRDEISHNAAECQVMVPFINEPWCKSGECDYEFKIALRHSLTGGRPIIMPFLLEDFSLYKKYPTVNGFLCNKNGIVATDGFSESVWAKLLEHLEAQAIRPTLDSQANPKKGPLSISVSNDTISVNGNSELPGSPSTLPPGYTLPSPTIPYSPLPGHIPSLSYPLPSPTMSPASPLPPGYQPPTDPSSSSPVCERATSSPSLPHSPSPIPSYPSSPSLMSHAPHPSSLPTYPSSPSILSHSLSSQNDSSTTYTPTPYTTSSTYQTTNVSSATSSASVVVSSAGNFW